ncbi:uncharacterized protein LOC134832587 isoform X2 [Culicoides brevitarsis]|uniref:uncharacterized protein LOC134832587 isoform X2 n=1 Tax=Culicoides brevitarsis TaxID=469753 RepID=UPI00307B3C76
MRSSIIACSSATKMMTATRDPGTLVSRSTGKKSTILCLFYFLTIINLCSSSFYGDKNNFNKNHFTTHHPLRHHRHHALNRTHSNYHHLQHHRRPHELATEAFTTRSPIESVRNFLSSREYDTNRNYYHVSSTKRPPNTANKSRYDQKSTRNHRNIQSSHYQKAKEKTFDDIVREISQYKKRKRFHKTTTTTTTTTEAPSEDDYVEYDDDADFQADEEGTYDNGYLAPERQPGSSSEKYVPAKKQDTRQIQNDPPQHEHYNPGDLTDLKFRNFGTRQDVRKQFNMHVESQKASRKEWQDHYRRNLMETRCKDPKPQVFPSSTDPTRLYTPRCTILYRCSDDTACCPSVDKTCVANTKEWIELAFMVNFPLNGTSRQIFESFENHTSCHCVLKSVVASSRAAPAPITRPKQCQCPRIFTEVLEDNGDCKCECLSHECQMIRKGQEHFSMEERSCISRGICKRPHCDYGHYITHEGRCPRREEKFDALSGAKQHHHLY